MLTAPLWKRWLFFSGDEQLGFLFDVFSVVFELVEKGAVNLFRFRGYTVPPENIYPFTEVLPRPIRRLTPRSCLGKDAACQSFTEVLPRFAAAYNIAVNGKTR